MSRAAFPWLLQLTFERVLATGMDSACGRDMGVKGDADKDLKDKNAMGDVIIPSADNEDCQPGIFSLLIHEAWDFRPENRA